MIEGMSSELFWFLVGLVLILAELATPGFIVIFFGIGAWITTVGVAAGWLTTPNSQLIVFLAASLGTTALFRRHVMKFFEGRVSQKMAPREVLEELKGSRAIALTDLVPGDFGGKVELNGTVWQAVAAEPVSRGVSVEVVERNDLTLTVRPIR